VKHNPVPDDGTDVSRWLSKEESPIRIYSPHIYPQGSLALGTTTKPMKYDEFDLDLVCQMSISAIVAPDVVYRLIWDRMAAHGTYTKITEAKPRCIRLNYAGDFHLDIVPAIPDPSCEPWETCVFVPDRDLRIWQASNPRGYARWYEGLALPTVNRYFRENIEPLPVQQLAVEKPALKRSTQLLKRWRDIEFLDREELEPSSIILTTLAGLSYGGEQLCTDALETILDKIVAWAGPTPRRLLNPTNPKESICEKWFSKPNTYAAFRTAITEFRDQWKYIVHKSRMPETARLLKELFGEAPVDYAIREAAQRIVKASEARQLSTASGSGILLTGAASGSIGNRPHTFHGQ
jgi:hypothetical protein